MNRIEKMNEIRNICGFEQSKRAFFYRDEFVEIIEMIIDRELSEIEQEMSIKTLVEKFLPEWKQQSTAVNHPSLVNVEYILELIDYEEVIEEEVSEDDNTDCCIAEVTTSPIIALTDFIIQGLNESFSHNILAVSVCANDPKQFTITLK